MRRNRHLWFATVLVWLLVMAASANAQIAGRTINPNVVILLDTGTAMDWIPDYASPGGEMQRALDACEQANELVPGVVARTSWQETLDALMGQIPPADFHCFVEPSPLRPMIGTRAPDDGPGIDPGAFGLAHNTEEYWTSGVPHFRAVSCWDPRESTDRGHWNAEYGQCIGQDVSGMVTLPTGHMCLSEDHFVVDGRDICLDYHPLAEFQSRPSTGILDRYRSLARFGLITFDNMPAPAGSEKADNTDEHDGLWDFGMDRNWFITRYQENNPSSTATRIWNAGARSDHPSAVGRMVRVSDNFEQSVDDLGAVLNSVEPLHCSFDSAFFDDLGHYLFNAAETKPKYNQGYGAGNDYFYNCRPRVMIFITDGVQTDAVEFPASYCNNGANGRPPDPPWEDSLTGSELYSCPFNSTTEEVKELWNSTSYLDNEDNQFPTYLVVIGMNMEPRGTTDCSTAPSWETDPGSGQEYCKPPSDDCIAYKALTKVECEDTANAVNNFLTPRQYLNELALAGWPEVGASVYGGTTPYDTIRVQPVWRSPDADDYSANAPVQLCVDNPDACGGETGDGRQYGALFATNGNELAAMIDMVLSSLGGEVLGTRTELATSENMKDQFAGLNFSIDPTAAAQYTYNSGYEAQSGLPWKGLLVRQSYTCQDGDSASGPIANKAVLLHKDMVGQTRTLYASKAPAAIDYTADVHYQKGLGHLEIFNKTNFTDCDVGMPTGACASKGATTGAISLVVDHMYGNIGERAASPLADIYNSTPAVQGPAREQIPISTYENFKTNLTKVNNVDVAHKDRPPFLYVGTNDGVLHSFNVWDDATKAENWGFIPSPLMDTIKDQFPIRWEEVKVGDVVTDYTVPAFDDQYGVYQHIFGVDGSPVAKDALLYSNPSGDATLYWRSLVMGGLGNGGEGYYCLDVTDTPDLKPSYRWEISPNNQANNDATASTNFSLDSSGDPLTASEAFKEMGQSLSKPALAYAHVNAVPPKSAAAGKEYHNLAVAILPGGRKTGSDGGLGESTGVYIVRAIDGKLIRYLKPTVDDDLCDKGKSGLYDSQFYSTGETDTDGDGSMIFTEFGKVAQLVGEPVIPVPISTGTTAGEAYIGDDRGRLWRIKMSSNDGDPADWCLELFFDTLITSHFPQQDCLDDNTNLGSCCSAKNSDVTQSCTAAEQLSFAADPDMISADSCKGLSCSNPDFPFSSVSMLAPPTIVQDEDRNNIIVFGTGQYDGLETLDHHRVFAIKVNPIINVDSSSGSDVSSAAYQGPEILWWLGESPPSTKPVADQDGELGALETQMETQHFTKATSLGDLDYFGLGEKLVGRISVFDERAFFTTFSPLEKNLKDDSCDSGGSKLWGVKFDHLTVDPETDADFDKMPNSDSPSGYYAYQEFMGELLTGAKIIRRPDCSGSDAFLLVAQKATPPAAPGTTTDHSSNPNAINTVQMALTSNSGSFTTVGIDSWSLVFE